jgi:hypothetical protein
MTEIPVTRHDVVDTADKSIVIALDATKVYCGDDRGMDETNSMYGETVTKRHNDLHSCVKAFFVLIAFFV